MPEKKQQVTAIALIMLIVLLSVFPIDVLLPSFPVLSEHFQRPTTDIALSVSLFVLGIALSQLFIGPLSDVFGRKYLLLGGIAVTLVGGLGCAVSVDFLPFMFFRMLQALGCGCFVLCQALIQDLFEGQERTRVRILQVTATGVLISLSPLAGTFLQWLWGWRGGFYVYCALALLIWLLAWRNLDNRSPVATPPRKNLLQGYRLVLGNFAFVGNYLLSALAFSCHFAFIVVSPILFMEQLGLSQFQYGLMLLGYGAAYIAGGFGAGWLNRRIAPDTQVVAGLGLILLSAPVMLLLSHQYERSALTILLPMLLCTAGTTLVRPTVSTRAMEIFPDNAGVAASAGSTLIFVAAALISALVSLFTRQLEWTLALSFIGFSTAGLVLNSRLGKHRSR